MYCMCFSKSYIAYGFFSLFTISKFCFYFHVCEFIFCFTAQGISCFGNNVFPSLDYTHTHAHTCAHTHIHCVTQGSITEAEQLWKIYKGFIAGIWHAIVGGDSTCEAGSLWNMRWTPWGQPGIHTGLSLHPSLQKVVPLVTDLNMHLAQKSEKLTENPGGVMVMVATPC